MVQFEVPKVKKKIVAIDFDGTIIDNHYPTIENPRMDVINFIKRHRRKFTWILWTCRTGDRLREAVDYMKDVHGVTFDYVNENTKEMVEMYVEDCRKVYADYYIDDKNATLAEVR